jgi:hypothetical protein
MNPPQSFELTQQERQQLEDLAKRDPDNIRKVADELRGEARDKYLLALRRRMGVVI